MENAYYVKYMKDNLTGNGVLECELGDAELTSILEESLMELQEWYDQTTFITIEGAHCIDLKEIEESEGIKICRVEKLFRTKAVNGLTTESQYNTTMDPIFLGYWQTAGGYNLSGYTASVINYNQLMRLRSTMSTDLFFEEDKIGRKLYVNFTDGIPAAITMAYVPILDNANIINGEYWTNILMRYCLAKAKIRLGRIRTRYVQSGAQWTDDGQAILTEGNNELQALRDRLIANIDYIMPVD